MKAIDNQKIRILILEDFAEDAKLIQYALKKDGLQFDSVVVDTREDFIKTLKEFNPLIILSDHSMSGFDSTEALRITKNISGDIPFILVTGTVSEEFAVSIIKAGASDYILKDNLSRLSVAIVSAINQKEAKEKLKRKEEQFQHTIDGMIDGVLIIGYDWKYLYANDIILKRGKHSKEELIGYTVMEKYPDIEKTEIFQHLKNCMEDRVLIEMEHTITTPEGTPEWFQLIMQPAPQGVLVLSRDITDKKKYIQTLQDQNEKIIKINAELDRFLYSVSHELRAPICTGLGLVNVARIVKTETELKDILSRLESSIKNHDLILQNLRLFFDINRLNGRYEKVCFEALLDESINQLKQMEGFQETHLTVSVETNNSFYSVKNYLLILFKNLITNSIKFRNKDKECTVNISVQINAKEATIIIKDNGLGIEQKHLDNIFKVFYKVANNPGGGLGLFMVDKIIEKLQGKINVESKVGVGTTFTISVPNTMENRVKDLQSLEMK